MRYRLVVVVLMGLGAMLPARSAAGAAGGPWIAAAVNGNIVLFAANGSGKRVLTHGGVDSAPVMGPDGRSVAFLRSASGPRGTKRTIAWHWIMVASPTGSGYHIARFSPQATMSTPSERTIAWEPRTQPVGLTWFDSVKVIWRRAGRNEVPILAAFSSPFAPPVPIAWAPNDLSVAVPLSNAGPVPSPVLRIEISYGHSRRLIVPRFRPGVLALQLRKARGSYPVGDDLTFDSTGKHLLFGTIAAGAGRQLTGIFSVPVTGGIARMVLGNGHGVHGVPPFGPGLAGATDFALSPNKRFLATDQEAGLWVSGNTAKPLAIKIPRPLGCQLTQWRWLPDSSGFAYVQACTVPGASPLRYRLTLGTISRAGTNPHTLLRLESSNQEVIDLAPVQRCVACG